MPCRMVFFPVWIFHAVVARGRFSLPAPSVPHNRHVSSYSYFRRLSVIQRTLFHIYLNQNSEITDKEFYLMLNVQNPWSSFLTKIFPFWQWAPCHAIVATPLLIAFELLLCIYLESIYGMCKILLLVIFVSLRIDSSFSPFISCVSSHTWVNYFKKYKVGWNFTLSVKFMTVDQQNMNSLHKRIFLCLLGTFKALKCWIQYNTTH